MGDPGAWLAHNEASSVLSILCGCVCLQISADSGVRHLPATVPAHSENSREDGTPVGVPFGSTAHGTTHCETALGTPGLPTTPHVAVSSLAGSSIVSSLFLRDHRGNVGLLCLPPVNSQLTVLSNYSSEFGVVFSMFFEDKNCLFFFQVVLEDRVGMKTASLS